MQFKSRPRCETSYAQARDAGLSALTANVVARRVSGFSGDMGPLLEPSLAHLAPPQTLPDIAVAVHRLRSAIERRQQIAIVTDYDVDGITSHALLRQALLRNFGHPTELLGSFIGHRLTDGYGLSDNVCAQILAAPSKPAVVITADCGTSDGPRIERLAAAGIDVIVTDHHGVPDDGVPAAALATVNPAVRDCAYPDPAIAGCMVAWLLMAALRIELVTHEVLPADAPKLADTLDLVALGTVADAVSLFSPNNRAVVTAGLKTLNQRARPCWQALAALLGKQNKRFDVEDLGFQIGPRINARGRMADPFAALRFLEASSADEAARYLAVLDQDNLDRRETEKHMLQVARRRSEARLDDRDQVVCVFDPEFHPGVQGIVASRLLDAYGRVAAVLSPGRETGLVSGSLRSVDGVDIGAALRDMARAQPSLLVGFGGHPKAAGVTLAESDVEIFTDALCRAVREQLGDVRLSPQLWHDGELDLERIDVDTLRELERLAPYGRGFEPPRFCNEFALREVRAVGADPVHLALTFEGTRGPVRAIWFRALAEAGDDWPVTSGQRVACVYRLTADSYRGGDAVQLIVEHARTASE